MSVVTDYPDYSPHVATATQIANTGAPLLTMSNKIFDSGSQVIAPGSPYTPPGVAVSQIGYEVWARVSFGSGATAPFVQVQLAWEDPATTLVTATDTFVLTGASSALQFITFGRGPTKAADLEIGITNLDPSVNATVRFVVLQNSRVYPQDQWTGYNANNNGATIPGYNLAYLPADESVLGVLDGISVAAGSNSTYLHGTAPGQQVTYAGHTSGIAAASIVVIVTAQPPSAYDSAGEVLHTPLSANTFSFTFTAPRAPLLVEWANNATTGTLVVTGMMTAATP